MSVEQQRNLAEETLTRVETERIAAVQERDFWEAAAGMRSAELGEARQVARELLNRLRLIADTQDYDLRISEDWERKHPWLKEKP